MDLKRKTTESEECHDCGALLGRYHLKGCSVEECPFCHGQLSQCECKYQQLGLKVDSWTRKLTPAENKKWKVLLNKKGRIRHGFEHYGELQEEHVSSVPSKGIEAYVDSVLAKKAKKGQFIPREFEEEKYQKNIDILKRKFPRATPALLDLGSFLGLLGYKIFDIQSGSADSHSYDSLEICFSKTGKPAIGTIIADFFKSHTTLYPIEITEDTTGNFGILLIRYDIESPESKRHPDSAKKDEYKKLFLELQKTVRVITRFIRKEYFKK